MYISKTFKDAVRYGCYSFLDGLAVMPMAGVSWELVDQGTGEVLVSSRYLRCLFNRLAELNYTTANEVTFHKNVVAKMRGK